MHVDIGVLGVLDVFSGLENSRASLASKEAN